MNVTPATGAGDAVRSADAGRATPRENTTRDAGFEAMLRQSGLKLSSHARDRLNLRDIDMGEAEARRLGRAVEAAESKGSKSSLLLMDRLALIVNVPSRRIVTACDRDRLHDGVFTNIDSTVIVRE